MKRTLFLSLVVLSIVFLAPQAYAQAPTFSQLGDCTTTNTCPTSEPQVTQPEENQPNTDTPQTDQAQPPAQDGQTTTKHIDNSKLTQILEKLLQLLKDLLNNKCDVSSASEFSANAVGGDDIEANHKRKKKWHKKHKRGLKKHLNCLKTGQPKKPTDKAPTEPTAPKQQEPPQAEQPTQPEQQPQEQPAEPPQQTNNPASVSPTTWVAPSTEKCSANYALTNSTNKNFGDPACTFTKDDLSALLQQLDATNADKWFNMIVPCESSYNPNAFAPPVGAQAQLDAGGAWGLFQMGSAKPPGSPPPAPGKNGVNDRGDVNWGVQAVNATTYQKKNGFAYWACAK